MSTVPASPQLGEGPRFRNRTPWWRRVLRGIGGRMFRLAENNDDSRLAHNGEGWLLRELMRAHVRQGSARPFVACDAGANAGDYTREILRVAREERCPVAVHVFEPAPACVEVLRRAFASEAEVRIVAAALGEAPGEALLYNGRSGSSQASLVPRHGHADEAAEHLPVPVIRLDNYLREQNIALLDLLKLDVEGSELAALRGLGDWLRPEAVAVVQFEYGGTTLDARTSLRDFAALFHAHGYVLAKLFPRALEQRDYQPWMDHFAYSNYVAMASRRRP